jgi:putative addiction module component (TIGR02574 family)
MVAPTDQLEQSILQLPATARARLALRLIESLDDEAELRDVEAEWQEEIQRRREEVESGAVVARPATEVFASARAALRQS